MALDLDAKRRELVRPQGQLAPFFAAASEFLAAHPFIKFALNIALSWVLAVIINNLRPKPEKQKYRWQADGSSTGLGVAVPVIYGRHKTSGHIVQSYIETLGDRQWANLLIVLSEGWIHDITNIQVNGQPIENYKLVEGKRSWYTWERTGTPTQGAVDNWKGGVRNSRSVGVPIEDGGSHVVTTVADDCTDMVLTISFPRGLVFIDQQKGIKNNTVGFGIKYKRTDLSTWSTEKLFKVERATTSNFVVTYSAKNDFYDANVPIDGHQYDISVRRLTHAECDQYFYTTTTRKAGSKDEPYYETVPVYPPVYRGNQSYFDTTVDYVDEVSNLTSPTYPRTALLSVKMLATNLVSGGFPEVTCVVEGRKFNIRKNGVWIEATNETLPITNPAWIVYDLLLSDRYGLGNYVSVDDIDVDSFEEFAAYCDELVPLKDANGNVVSQEPRHTCNIILDSQEPAIDVIQKILSPCRGILVETDGKYRLIAEKAEQYPTQIFTMGNIVKDSFQTHWTNFKEEYNTVEVLYNDASKDWRRNSIRFSTASTPSNPTAVPANCKLVQVELPGVTSYSQAKREAVYRLNMITALSQSVEFDTALDAITCRVGDVVGVSHDVPQWGFSGRLKSISGTSVTLDRDDFSLETGKTYEIIMRYPDDIIHTIPVLSATGNSLELNEAAPTLPTGTSAVDVVYACGEVTKSVKLFRVASITLNEDLTRHITAYEYDSRVYDDVDVYVDEAPTVSALPNPTVLPQITSMTIAQRSTVTADNKTRTIVDIMWQPPTSSDGIYRNAKVYVREIDEIEFRLLGTGYDSLSVEMPAGTYDIAIIPLSAVGTEPFIDEQYCQALEVLGKVEAVSPPTDVTATGESSSITVSWGAPSSPDVVAYVVLMGEYAGFTAQDAVVAWQGNALSCNILVPGGKTRYFRVRAVDSYGTPSTDSIEATATSRNTTYRQATAPTVVSVGDVWIDTDAGNHLYWWDGSVWQDGQDLTPDLGSPSSLADVTVTFDSGVSYQDSQGHTYSSAVMRIYGVPSDARRAFIQVKHRVTGVTLYTLDDQYALTSGDGVVNVDELMTGVSYDFALVPVSHYGVEGIAWTGTQTTGVDTTPPVAPVVTVSGGVQSVVVKTNTDTESDWARDEVEVLCVPAVADNWAQYPKGVTGVTVPFNDSYTGLRSQSVYLSNGEVAEKRVESATVSNCQPGQTVTLTVWAKLRSTWLTQPEVKIGFNFYDDPYIGSLVADMRTTIIPTSSWQQFTYTVTIPTNGYAFKVLLGLASVAQTGSCTVLFDDVNALYAGVNALRNDNPSFEVTGSLNGWVPLASGKQNLFLIPGLQAGNSYYARARRFDMSGNVSAYSSTASASTLATIRELDIASDAVKWGRELAVSGPAVQTEGTTSNITIVNYDNGPTMPARVTLTVDANRDYGVLAHQLLEKTHDTVWVRFSFDGGTTWGSWYSDPLYDESVDIGHGGNKLFFGIQKRADTYVSFKWYRGTSTYTTVRMEFMRPWYKLSIYPS